MHVTEGHGDLDCVEACTLFWESCDLSEVHEKLTTTDESHDEEDFLFGLEYVAHTYQEGVVGL